MLKPTRPSWTKRQYHTQFQDKGYENYAKEVRQNAVLCLQQQY